MIRILKVTAPACLVLLFAFETLLLFSAFHAALTLTWVKFDFSLQQFLQYAPKALLFVGITLLFMFAFGLYRREAVVTGSALLPRLVVAFAAALLIRGIPRVSGRGVHRRRFEVTDILDQTRFDLFVHAYLQMRPMPAPCVPGSGEDFADVEGEAREQGGRDAAAVVVVDLGRRPERGPGAAIDLHDFALSVDDPVLVDGDRAAVEWSAETNLKDGGTEKLAGVSLLRFDEDGLVVEQRDFWGSG